MLPDDPELQQARDRETSVLTADREKKNPVPLADTENKIPATPSDEKNPVPLADTTKKNPVLQSDEAKQPVPLETTEKKNPVLPSEEDKNQVPLADRETENPAQLSDKEEKNPELVADGKDEYLGQLPGQVVGPDQVQDWLSSESCQDPPGNKFCATGRQESAERAGPANLNEGLERFGESTARELLKPFLPPGLNSAGSDSPPVIPLVAPCDAAGHPTSSDPAPHANPPQHQISSLGEEAGGSILPHKLTDSNSEDTQTRSPTETSFPAERKEEISSLHHKNSPDFQVSCSYMVHPAHQKVSLGIQVERHQKVYHHF